jgi:hypothetical protein
MTRKSAHILAVALLLLACGILVGFYFFYSFGHLQVGLRWVGAVLTALLVCAGTYLTYGCASRLGMVSRAMCLLAALCGIAALGMRADVFPSPMGISIEDPQGGKSTLAVDLNNVWGKSLWTYQMDLGGLAGRTLAVSFPIPVNRVKIYLTGMPGSWVRPVANGDFSIDFNAAFEAAPASTAHTTDFVVSAAELAAHRWNVHTIKIPGTGESALRWNIDMRDTPVAVKGPIYFAVQVTGWQGYLFAAGKVLLGGLGAWLIATSMALALASARGYRGSSTTAEPSIARRVLAWAFPIAAFAAVLGVLVYWSSSRTHYIFFWDYRIHWVRTQQLFSLMAASGWGQALDSFIQSYPANYSMLPAVIPAFLSFATGFPGRVDYAFIIAMVYALPAYVLVAYCGRQLVRPLRSESRSAWAWSIFAIFVSMPVYLGMILYMMPDIGGVAFTAAALLLAGYLIDESRRNAAASSDDDLRAVSAAALGLGLALAAMFLYRRWYVFASVGVVAALLVFFALDWRRHGYSWSALRARLRSVILVAFAGLPLLAPVFVDWAANLGAHNYNDLYSSYKFPAKYDFSRFVQAIGALAPLGVLAFYVCGMSLKLHRRFLALLLMATAVATVLFYQIQSPGLHHYYLLMPFLGIGVASAFQYLWARFGVKAAVGATCCVALYGGVITMADGLPAALQQSFPGYRAWLPKKQPGAEGVTALTKWLLEPGIASHTFCLVASSMVLNQSMLSESWQIIPSIPPYPFGGRMINQAQVDSVNGPPFETIRSCDIALVGTPLQQHLQDGQQDNVKILWQEISGGYGIGVHFEKLPIRFDLDGGVAVIPYKRATQISHEDYLRLVERYRDMNGKEAAGPR